MEQDLFTGKLVRLTAVDSQRLAEADSRWGRDSEYWRLQASDPAHLFSVKRSKEWLEKDLEKDATRSIFFEIHTLEDDRLIGVVGFEGFQWQHGDVFVGIGLGEREAWGKGYGTDAMRVILRYGFTELNLHRVSLDVFEYNPRAIRSYEKAGFKHEGRLRQYLQREGRRWDLIFMGITESEWYALYSGE
ncbi:MAG TPA: GNAT family protein [Anaerolineales bacterium]|nr:GNAT family protein [Anaerolineales bacterium]